MAQPHGASTRAIHRASVAGSVPSASGARNGRPGLKPYVYRGNGGDAAERARKHAEQVRAFLASREETTPDPHPDPEWSRELDAAGDL